jgi:hypothetical protein
MVSAPKKQLRWGRVIGALVILGGLIGLLIYKIAV